MDKRYVSRQGLTKCPVCQTMVKLSSSLKETTCPFCEAAITVSGDAAPMAASRKGMSGKSALLVASLFGMSALGAGYVMTGCDPTTPTEQAAEQTVSDGGSVEKAPDQAVGPLYGGPPDTNGQNDSGPKQDAPVLPPYGIPPDRR